VTSNFGTKPCFFSSLRINYYSHFYKSELTPTLPSQVIRLPMLGPSHTIQPWMYGRNYAFDRWALSDQFLGQVRTTRSVPP
jgi:hypothetical protein